VLAEPQAARSDIDRTTSDSRKRDELLMRGILYESTTLNMARHFGVTTLALAAGEG
jgi:hypothetical protein